jgi:hypothetical protein
MKSMTYGILPTREDFNAAFELECPAGYRISLGLSDSLACKGFLLGVDGLWPADGLWAGITQIVSSRKRVRSEERMALVSSILETLGFEWI